MPPRAQCHNNSAIAQKKFLYYVLKHISNSPKPMEPEGFLNFDMFIVHLPRCMAFFGKRLEAVIRQIPICYATIQSTTHSIYRLP
ncbi:hypothetical protein TNCT_88561 [Trichonephila clavata]|uniref:Uncharacterized protein n=1 Tax=Trichonephila clavata TaxID=2740835 RepID=A0A8X6GK79_TRICU|nr:hypothetical protein TNCT_88561 [Trichonephila clavata]